MLDIYLIASPSLSTLLFHLLPEFDLFDPILNALFSNQYPSKLVSHEYRKHKNYV